MPRESLEGLRKQVAMMQNDLNALKEIHGQDQQEIARLKAIMLVLKSALEMAER
jgi:hypothetical protein